MMEVAETTKQVLQGDSDCADEDVKAVDARRRDIQGKYMASGWNTTTLNAFGYAPGGGASGTDDKWSLPTSQNTGVDVAL